MVGSGNKKGDGLPAINSTNIFSALERRRSKSSSRRKLEREKSKGKDESGEAKQEEQAQFWSATQVSVKSWADCDDEDDYFATTAPPPDIDVAPVAEPKEALSQGEVSFRVFCGRDGFFERLRCSSLLRVRSEIESGAARKECCGVGSR